MATAHCTSKRKTMFIKVSVLVLCIGFGNCAKLAAPQPRDIFDDADALLAKYRSTVVTVGNLSYYQQGEFIGDSNALANVIWMITYHMLDVYEKEFFLELDKLIVLGEEQGLNLTSCTVVPAAEIGEMRYGILDMVRECLDLIMHESFRTVEDAFAHFNREQLNATADQYAKRVEDSKLAEDEIGALVVMSQMELEIQMLPVLLEDTIQEVSSQLSNLQLFYQSCPPGPRDEYIANGRVLVAAAKECVDNWS